MNHFVHVWIIALILFLPLVLGLSSSAVVAGRQIPSSRSQYSPPPWVFGVVWTFLYLCLGLSSALIYRAEGSILTCTMRLYWVHLFFLTLWYPLFVLFPKYTMIFFTYILLLWASALYIAYRFYAISPLSAYLLIPYLIWLLCASYLCYFSSEKSK